MKIEGAVVVTQLNKVSERDPMAAPLARYGERYQKTLAECAGVSERIAQLATTYPVLFFALATKYGPLEERRAVIRLAVDGRPLSEISAAIGLPACFRRLPPEACSSALPYVRWGEDANRRLATHVPNDPAVAAAWLAEVQFAARSCDETFAIWIAGQRSLFEGRAAEPGNLLPLALFAWQSRYAHQVGLTSPPQPWMPCLGVDVAIMRASDWLRELRSECLFAAGELAESWVPESAFKGFTFKPLTTMKSLKDEAAAMRNCVHTYGQLIAEGECQLFSLRQQDHHLATIQIQPFNDGYTIAQLKGPANANCDDGVRLLATLWLRQFKRRTIKAKKFPRQRTANERLQEILDPYQRFLTSEDDPCHLTGISFASLIVRLRSLITRISPGIGDQPAG